MAGAARPDIQALSAAADQQAEQQAGHARDADGLPGIVVHVAARATDDYVHDNPWQAIGIAGVTGLLLGLLISRR